MNATVTLLKEEIPELAAFVAAHEDPEQFESAEEIEVRLVDVEYTRGFKGSSDCPEEPAGITGGYEEAFVVLADGSEVEITDVKLVSKIIDSKAEMLDEFAAACYEAQEEYERDAFDD